MDRGRSRNRGSRGSNRGKYRPNFSRGRGGSHSKPRDDRRLVENRSASPLADLSGAPKPVKFTRILRKEGVILRRAGGQPGDSLEGSVSPATNEHPLKAGKSDDNNMVDLEQEVLSRRVNSKTVPKQPDAVNISPGSPISDISDLELELGSTIEAEVPPQLIVPKPAASKKTTVKVIKRSDGSTVVVSGGKIIKKKSAPKPTKKPKVSLTVKQVATVKPTASTSSKQASNIATVKPISPIKAPVKQVATVKPTASSSKSPSSQVNDAHEPSSIMANFAEEMLSIKRTINTDHQNDSCARISQSTLLSLANDKGQDFSGSGCSQNDQKSSSRPLRSVKESSPANPQSDKSPVPARRIVRRKRPSGDEISLKVKSKKGSLPTRRQTTQHRSISPNRRHQPSHPPRVNPRRSRSVSPPPRVTNSRRLHPRSSKEPLLKRAPELRRRVSPPRQSPEQCPPVVRLPNLPVREPSLPVRKPRSPVRAPVAPVLISPRRSRSSTPRRSPSPLHSQSSSPSRNISILEMLLGKRSDNSSEDEIVEDKSAARRRKPSTELLDQAPSKSKKQKVDQFPKTKTLGDSENIPKLLEEERNSSQADPSLPKKIQIVEPLWAPDITQTSYPQTTAITPVAYPQASIADLITYPQPIFLQQPIVSGLPSLLPPPQPIPSASQQQLTTASSSIAKRKLAALESLIENSKTGQTPSGRSHSGSKSALSRTVEKRSDTDPIRSRRGKSKKSKISTTEIDRMLIEEERLKKIDRTADRDESDMDMSDSDTETHNKILLVEPEDGQTPSFRRVSAPKKMLSPQPSKTQAASSIKIKLAKELEEEALSKLQNDLDHIQTSQDVADNIQAVENKIRALAGSNLDQGALARKISRYQSIVAKIFAKATKIKEKEDTESKITYHQRSFNNQQQNLDVPPVQMDPTQYHTPKGGAGSNYTYPSSSNYPPSQSYSEDVNKSPEEIYPHMPLDQNYSQGYGYNTANPPTLFNQPQLSNHIQPMSSTQSKPAKSASGEMPLRKSMADVPLAAVPDYIDDPVERINKQYVSQQPGYFVCLLCKIECQNQKSFEMHLNGKKHAQYVQEKLADPTARFKPTKGPKNKRHNIIVRCLQCEVICKGEEKYNSHCLERGHVKATKEYLKLGRGIPEPEILYNHDDDIKEQVEKIEEEGVPAVGRDYVMNKDIKDYDDNLIEVFHCKLCRCNLRNEVQVERHIRCKKHYLNYVKVESPQLNVPLKQNEHKKRKKVAKDIYNAMQNVRRVEESLELEEADKQKHKVLRAKHSEIKSDPISPPDLIPPGSANPQEMAMLIKKQIQSTSAFLARAGSSEPKQTPSTSQLPMSSHYQPPSTNQPLAPFLNPYESTLASNYQPTASSHYQPPTSQYQSISSSQYQLPPTSQPQASFLSQYQQPPSSQYQHPPSSQYQIPPKSQFEQATTGQYQSTPTGQYQLSTASHRQPPSSQQQPSGRASRFSQSAAPEKQHAAPATDSPPQQDCQHSYQQLHPKIAEVPSSTYALSSESTGRHPMYDAIMNYQTKKPAVQLLPPPSQQYNQAPLTAHGPPVPPLQGRYSAQLYGELLKSSILI